MKKQFFTILFSVLSFTLSIAQTSTLPSGSGTSGDPYLIATLDNLYWMSQQASFSGKYFRQTANIDATTTSGWDGGKGFSPIVILDNSSEYDGNNKTISNLYINRTAPATTYGGLFANVKDNSTIKDLALTNVSIIYNERYVGALVGRCYGSTISNCSSSGSVTSNNSRVGGLIGYIYDPAGFSSTIEDSYSSCNVKGTQYVGSFAAYFRGESGSGVIQRCYATGNAEATDGATSYVGGFLGYTQGGTSPTTECYGTGDAKGVKYVGGFIGMNRDATISNCYALGNATRTAGSTRKEMGGFCGRNYGGATIEKCYSTGSVYVEDGAAFTKGGFIEDDDGTSTNCFWDQESSNQSTNDSRSGCSAETTANMKTQATFTAAGWDFTSTWQINGANYPDLQNNSNPSLPVELVSFEAVQIDNSVILTWNTATEVNNYGFDVEASDDGVNFSKIGFVPGHGNSNAPNNYSFVATVYVSYRLKQIDVDGAFEYSDVVSVESELAKTELFQNSPNPFNPTTQIYFNLANASNVKISVYNVLGEKVTELINREMESGNHKVNFNGSELTSGVYIYKIDTPDYSKSMKMMLLK